jgi:hypothetical protein
MSKDHSWIALVVVVVGLSRCSPLTTERQMLRRCERAADFVDVIASSVEGIGPPQQILRRTETAWN